MDRSVIREHFDSIAGKYDRYKRRNRYYHDAIHRFCKILIPCGERVLEIGCATGDLLNLVEPREGIGVDLSPKMIEAARAKYPGLKFEVGEAESTSLEEKVDYIIMSNLLDYLEDIWVVLEKAKGMLNEDGKLVITTINPVWEPVFRLGQKLNLRTPDTVRNFVTNKDIVNLLELHDFEILKVGLKVFIPFYIPLLSAAVNFMVQELPFLRQLCIMQYIVAKPKRATKPLSCSVIIPCYNEGGNIADCLRRIPKMGSYTEAIVVDDGSSDGTAAMVKPELNRDITIKLISNQTNRGKGHAVRVGFDHAVGDVLMILDADMAVMPEELPRFLHLMEVGVADFVNGTRVIYPMEAKSMPVLNYFGNKCFSIILSWIMEQRVSDTLCGTKAMFRKDYKRMSLQDSSWGDFDLLFGAAKLCLRMRELPVHYKVRKAGESKMKAFRHGWILLRVCFKGFAELRLGR